MGTRSISSPTVAATLTFNVNNTVNSDSDTVSVLQGQALSTTFTSGTTDTKFDRGWESLARTLSTGVGEAFDLYDLGSIDIGAGAGLDATGQAFTNAELVAIQIAVDPTSTGSLYVGGEGTTAAFQSMFAVSGALSDTAQIVIPIGGRMLIWTTADPAWVITDTSNHLLDCTAVGGSVTYDIAFAFRSA